MFSIIIPLYNKAEYISKAIYSVIYQTFQTFEIIIVNDGSTDESLANLQLIINNLQITNNESFKQIKVIHQKNQGVSTARNNGVLAANYDYIAFLDADDWWEPTYLEEMKSLIAEFPKAGIYGSSYYKVKSRKQIQANIGVENGFVRGLINYCQVYSKTLYMPLWTGATVIKKTIFDSEHGFKSTLKLGEDFDLWVRVAIKYPIAFLNKPLANYNQDVELQHRAIGEKLYEPQEHMLFSDYGELNKNQDFRYLYERLAVYGLLPYYMENKNLKEVNDILYGINWHKHKFKYRLYYTVLPKKIICVWFQFLKIIVQFKNKKYLFP